MVLNTAAISQQRLGRGDHQRQGPGRGYGLPQSRASIISTEVWFGVYTSYLDTLILRVVVDGCSDDHRMLHVCKPWGSGFLVFFFEALRGWK